MIFLCVLFILCFVLSAFFSGSEMAFVSSNRVKLRELADSGHAFAPELRAEVLGAGVESALDEHPGRPGVPSDQRERRAHHLLVPDGGPSGKDGDVGTVISQQRSAEGAWQESAQIHNPQSVESLWI